MLWAIVSSAFVVYLYRRLNAPAGAETAKSAGSENAIVAELTKLNSRIDALENIISGKVRRIAP